MAGETIAIFLALLIGVSLGALGSGGSIVTLPILVYVAGVAPRAAVGMSLSIVGATSLLGCFFHWRQGNFRLRPAVIFGATGMVGQGVLRECLLDPDVESVLAIVRKTSLPQHVKLREIVYQDISDLSAIEDKLAEFDACFSVSVSRQWG